MRLENYINEVKPVDPFVWSKLIEEIRKNCKPFIKQAQGTVHFPLWRGAKKLIDDFRVINPHFYRQPMDTPKRIQDILDEIFQKKFGWKPRSQGVFGTGDKGFASMYGRPHIFIPIGEIKFIWSADMKDLYEDLIQRNAHEYADMTDEEVKKVLGQAIKKANYSNRDLPSALGSYSEVMVKCNSYYLINQDFEYDYKHIF